MSGDVRKVKKDKEIVVELECQIRDINQQFVEQMKSLDHRLEIFLGVVWEMQDYYRKQAEVEAEYSRNLEKMSKQIALRHKDNKQKRESWVGYSSYQAWQGLVSNTRQMGKDHAALAEILNNLAAARLGEIGEDMQRIYRKCKEVTLKCQEDISKVLTEVLNAMKTYHQYHGESQVAENKLLRVQSQKVKVDQQSVLAKKFVNYEKKSEKKQAKYVENKLKSLKARNEYLLSIDIANAAIGKYFREDFPRMVRKMDAGYHSMVQQVLEIHAATQRILSERENSRVVGLSVRAKGVQGSSDYDNFFASCQRIFQTPAEMRFQSHKGDEVTQICSQKPVLDEILVRLDQISIRLNKEKENKAEAAKAYEQSEGSFFERLRTTPVCLESFFPPSSSSSDDNKSTGGAQSSAASASSRSPTDKQREDKLRVEDAFVEMYKENLLRDNLIVRLQTKYDSLRKSLGEDATEKLSSGYRPPMLPPKPKKKMAECKPGKEGARPKLFGGSIEEYVEVTGEAIPSIMRSCIKVINSYGMSHQGIFRVSGSVNEMANYKAMFEQGEDPLVHKMDGDDINAVAGLLKLYLRELREPLFPSEFYDDLVRCAEAVYSNDAEKNWKEMLKANILEKLSPQRIVVMRYLFAFLSHVTEYSDENMMEAFNLSICFGPTLVIPPADRTDQHQYQGLVNDLIKNVILHYEEVYPPPTQEDYEDKAVYEKFLGADFLGSTSDDDILKGTVNEEDEDPDDREATVEEDYRARNDEELTCVRGDTVNLVKRENNEFWTVEHQSRVGLLPDKVLSAKRSHSTLLRKCNNLNKSTECLTTTTTTATSDLNGQSNPSLLKTSSNHNVSENGTHHSAVAPAASGLKYRASNASLLGVGNRNAPLPADAMVRGVPSSTAQDSNHTNNNNSNQHQQPLTTSAVATPGAATTRYQQTLIPVLPPLPRTSFHLADSNSQRASLTSVAAKKRNVSLSSELDVIVTPPSPSEDDALPFPVPPPASRNQHDPVAGKHSSPAVGWKRPAVPAASSGKWNSLPHDIPPVGSFASDPPVEPPVASHPKVPPVIPTPGSSFQQATPPSVHSATLPRQSDKQSSAPPPMVRAKPVLPVKKRTSTEDRTSESPETVPKENLVARTTTLFAPSTTTQMGSTPLNTFGRPVKTSDQTPPGCLDDQPERIHFSSFKMPSSSSGLLKKQ